MRTYKPLTVAEAYRRGLKAHCPDRGEALEVFMKRYCSHAWDQDGDCDLCIAWQNGYSDQLEPWRGVHAKNCVFGLADPNNHENCVIDE